MKRIFFDMRLSFNEVDVVFEEAHFLSKLPILDEEITKKILKTEGSNNASYVCANWNDFEQFIEYEEWYGTEFYDVLIHFVKKSNCASYFRFRCRKKIDKFVINEIVDDTKLMFNLFEIETSEFGIGRIKRKIDLNLRELNLENFYKCTPLNDHPFKTNICYVTDKEAFCISVQSVIRSLYSTIKIGNYPEYIEKLVYYTNFGEGIVNFSFESDKNLYHHKYEKTDFSGLFYLSNLTGVLFNDGSEMYSSK